MATRQACVVLLLDALGLNGSAHREKYVKQVKSACVRLMKEMAVNDIGYFPNGLYAVHSGFLPQGIKELAAGFGFTCLQASEANFWQTFHRQHYFRRFPSDIAIIFPTARSMDWVNNFLSAGKEVWLLKNYGVFMRNPHGFCHVIEAPEEKEVEKEVETAITGNICVLWDVENFVPVHSLMGHLAVNEAEKMAQALEKFFRFHGLTIDEKTSFLCLKRFFPARQEFKRMASAYGFRIKPSPEWAQPAENRIVRFSESIGFKEGFLKQGAVSPDVVAVLSGDAHVAPAVEHFKQRKFPVWVISWQDRASKVLMETADKFFSFESVLRLAGVTNCVEIKEIPRPI